jgi:hypothetical protein
MILSVAIIAFSDRFMASGFGSTGALRIYSVFERSGYRFA